MIKLIGVVPAKRANVLLNINEAEFPHLYKYQYAVASITSVGEIRRITTVSPEDSIQLFFLAEKITNERLYEFGEREIRAVESLFGDMTGLYFVVFPKKETVKRQRVKIMEGIYV